MFGGHIRLHGQKGQTMAEYVVVLGLITAATVATLSVLSDSVLAAFERSLEIVKIAIS